jgi:senataxin
MNATKAMDVVRIGGESSIGSAVKPISLDQLINNKIQTKTGLQGLSSGETGREIKALLVEMDSLKHLREDKLKELTNFQDTLQKRTILEGEAQRLRMRRQELGNKLTALRDKIKSENRSLDGLRRQMRREVLLEADVVCSTLSGAGHEVLIDQNFEMVIIDEAAQSIELSSLIPLKFNSARCVLVGDPQQLPPTVISQEVSVFAVGTTNDSHLPSSGHPTSV